MNECPLSSVEPEHLTTNQEVAGSSPAEGAKYLGDDMKFLIQTNLMGADQLKLVKDAVVDLPHQFVELVPFTHEITSDEPIEGDDYIPYGSTLLTTVGYDHYHWKGLYFDLKNFNYESALKNRSDMLNDGHVVTIDKAIEFLRGRPSNEEEWFVRPNLDLKQFSGMVIKAKECADWFVDAMECDSSGTYKMAPETEVVLATPQVIQAEWRWFIVGGKVVSGSMYRLRGRLIKDRETDSEVIKDAQKLATAWLPNECCVMDTALVRGRLMVTEFNCINSSDFYDHDVDAIFKELYKYSNKLK